jgi:hypothetical protein
MTLCGLENLSPRLAALLPALVLLAPGPAHAQQYNDPGILQNSFLSKPANYQAEGIRLGAFMLSPSLDLVYEDHDNIYYQNENPVSESLYHARPRLTLSSGWSRHALGLSVAGDFARHADRSSEDYDDINLALDARIDVKRGKFFYVKAASMLLHEERSSPDDPGGVVPTDFSNRLFGIGYQHTFNRLTASLSLDRLKTDFDDNRDNSGAIINNQDRDRSQDSVKLQLNYQVMPQRAVFLALGTNTIGYDLPADDAGFGRDSDGFEARAGMTFSITGVLEGSAWLAYVRQKYEDPRFGSIDDTGFGMALDWSPTRLTRLRLSAELSPLETTQAFSPGYVGTQYSARLQHELRRYLVMHARFSYLDNAYTLVSGAPAESLTFTDITRAELGLSYLFNPRVQLTAGFTREKQDANLRIEQYEANRFFLTLGLDL